MRRKIIAANWKMNMTLSEADSYLESFLLEVANENGVDIVLIPPFTALARVSEKLSQVQNVKLGAQNMHYEKSGAFTGEVSAPMLRELFARYVVLGHSERRTLFGETDELVNRKTKAALAAALTPIVCIGETLAERDAGRVEEVLERQLAGSLADLTPEQLADVVIAYEPVWAIGSGLAATPEQAEQVAAKLRETLAELYGADVADATRILYGGSVKSGNIASLMREPNVDGALVGGASLDVAEFASIARFQKHVGT